MVYGVLQAEAIQYATHPTAYQQIALADRGCRAAGSGLSGHRADGGDEEAEGRGEGGMGQSPGPAASTVA